MKEIENKIWNFKINIYIILGFAVFAYIMLLGNNSIFKAITHLVICELCGIVEINTNYYVEALRLCVPIIAVLSILYNAICYIYYVSIKMKISK